LAHKISLFINYFIFILTNLYFSNKKYYSIFTNILKYYNFSEEQNANAYLIIKICVRLIIFVIIFVWKVESLT